MSIKEEIERLNDAIDNETSPNSKSFLLGKKAGVIETKQKMIEEFKDYLIEETDKTGNTKISGRFGNRGVEILLLNYLIKQLKKQVEKGK